MKKIIVVAAIALAAICTQAASVSWTVPGTVNEKGLSVYICSAIADGGFKDEADISNYLLGTEGNTGTFAGSRTVSAGGTVRGIDDSNDGKMVDFFYVIVNADGDGYWASKSSAQAYTTQGSHTDSQVAASVIMAGAATKFAGSSDPTVPEPTSGLLLVLGGAMLALRRKQK